MYEQVRLRAAIIRGGTSKGVYLLAKELPRDPTPRDRVILSNFGSPDLRQIDGLGGADPLTSKVAIIEVSRREGVDADFGYHGRDPSKGGGHDGPRLEPGESESGRP